MSTPDRSHYKPVQESLNRLRDLNVLLAEAIGRRVNEAQRTGVLAKPTKVEVRLLAETDQVRMQVLTQCEHLLLRETDPDLVRIVKKVYDRTRAYLKDFSLETPPHDLDEQNPLR